jgi:uncharacterized DUF497 family protein
MGAHDMMINTYTSERWWALGQARAEKHVGAGVKWRGMDLDFSSKRAKKLIREHGLSDEEIQQIVASARINLATFDPEYRTNVTQIAEELQKSRPTIYGWADRAIAATIHSLRNIRTGRPPKERERANGADV